MSETVFTVEATPIVYGRGAAREAGFHVSQLGVKRALVVTDPHVAGLGIAQQVRDALGESDIATDMFAEAQIEPNETSALQAIERAHEGGFDGVVGVGGGSSIDTAKIIALFATHGGELLDYVNKPIGKAIAPPGPLMPLAAIPTTSGTGSEASPNAIMDFPALGAKTAISHRYLRPRLGIVDPLFLQEMPGPVGASAGLDVVCHAIESYTARPFTSRDASAPAERPSYQGANPVADVWSARAIELGHQYLRRCVRDPDDLEARSQMMLAATTMGIGFGNAGVHVPHACAYPIASLKHAWTPAGYPTGHAFVPHGFSVAVTAPAAFRFTQQAGPARHEEAARLLTGGASDDLRAAMRALMEDVGAPTTLGELGYDNSDLDELASGALKQQRLLKMAPRSVTKTDLRRVLEESL